MQEGTSSVPPIQQERPMPTSILSCLVSQLLLLTWILNQSISGPPQIVGGPRDQFAVNDGRSAVFECTAIADPLHQILWDFNDSNGERMEEVASTKDGSRSDKYSINSNRTDALFGELTVNSVQFEDRGTYVCTAINANGFEEAQANLTVHGKLLIPITRTLVSAPFSRISS